MNYYNQRLKAISEKSPYSEKELGDIIRPTIDEALDRLEFAIKKTRLINKRLAKEVKLPKIYVAS